MNRHAFFTVTDHDFFAGTVAAVNSILLYHPRADVWVVEDATRPLTPAQRRCFAPCDRVHVMPACEITPAGSVLDPWSLKAQAASALLSRCDVLVGIDSDCVLCSDLEDVLALCMRTGGLAGGRARAGLDYDQRYAIYGISTPAHNPVHVITSLFVAASTMDNQGLFDRWATCCRAALFNGTGLHPGNGDEGVLNAIMFAEGAVRRTALYESSLWTQHGTFWESIIERRGREFINLTAGGRPQRAFHCAGRMKFWSLELRDRVVDTHPLQAYPYVWFLAMLWFGPCADWDTDPFEYLPPRCQHLLGDLIDFAPEIFQLHPPARWGWRQLSDPMLDRALAGIPRMMTAGGGNLTDVIRLIEYHPHVRRYVEVGSYEGGSILALGLRFAYRDIDFYAVESFTGNLDGTVDGYALPSRRRFVEHLQRFPGLRVRLVPGDTEHAATLFDDGSVDLVFIDARHDTASVRRDIETWLPKLSRGGIIAGDDYLWPTVRAAVDERFPDAHVASSGTVWWQRTRT